MKITTEKPEVKDLKLEDLTHLITFITNAAEEYEKTEGTKQELFDWKYKETLLFTLGVLLAQIKGQEKEVGQFLDNFLPKHVLSDFK